MSVTKSGSLSASEIYSPYIYVDQANFPALYSDFSSLNRIVSGDSSDFSGQYSILGLLALEEEPEENLPEPVIVFGANAPSGTRASAMVVRRSGDVDVAGALRVPPTGDLAMGSFTAGRDPRDQLDPNETLPSKDWGEETP
jgi:hypothetical protein